MNAELEREAHGETLDDAPLPMVAMLAVDGTIVAVNGSWLAAAEGAGADDGRTGVGANYFDVCARAAGVEADGAADMASGIRDVLRGRSRSFTCEYRCGSPGRTRWFLSNVTPLAGLQGAVVVHVDVTAQKHAEETLRAREARLLLAMSAADLVTWEWDLERDEVLWTSSQVGLSAPTRGSLSAFLAIVHPGDRRRLGRALGRAISSGREHDIEFRIVHPNTGIRWYALRGKVVRDARRRPIRMVGIANDVTSSLRRDHERVQMLAIERRARLATERASRIQNEFVAMVGHELRGPVAAARMALQAAHMRPTSAGHNLRIATRQLDHVTRLLNDLIDLEATRVGELQLSTGPVELVTVVECAIDEARPLVTEREQVLSVELPPEPLVAVLDAARVQQVAANLLINASRYTQRGGRIGVCLGREDGFAVLTVRDNGIGMTPDLVAHAFEPFVRGSMGAGAPQRAIGIGLAVVKRLVDAHGGTVEAHSEGPGRGAEFVVRLPTR